MMVCRISTEVENYEKNVVFYQRYDFAEFYSIE